VMDQATGYSVFATGGYTGLRHGITQIISRSGEVVYDHAREAPKPVRVLSPEATAAMNEMLAQVPEWGTGRRAALSMTRVAGKTGTSQAYRDAWFVGYTGNYVAAVWMGNDNFTPTNNMTGGSLPAMTWQRLMEFAHKNIVLKPIPGLGDTGPLLALQSGMVEGGRRPRALTPETSAVLLSIAGRMRDAPVLEPPPRPANLSALRVE